MPKFNITLEDTSPMIRYSANWGAGTSRGDSFADQYSESSFTLTQQEGATLEFDFYGTSITLFGATRANHGVYQGQMDGNSIFSTNGSSSTFAFNQALYTANSTLGYHSLVVSNKENRFFDVDYLIFQTNVGRDDEDLIVNSFEDNHPSFIYSPSSAWVTTSDKLGWFSGSTGQLPLGDAIALYGAVGPQGGDYTVQVDGKNSSIYSSQKSFYRPKELIFYAGNLGTGNHTVRIQLTPGTFGELGIDYANVYTSSSLGGRFLGSAPPNNTITYETKTPAAVMVGLLITSVLALAAILILIYVFRRLSQQNLRLKKIRQAPLQHAAPGVGSWPGQEPNVMATPFTAPMYTTQNRGDQNIAIHPPQYSTIS